MGFEVMMEALSNETLNSYENRGLTLGMRGQDFRRGGGGNSSPGVHTFLQILADLLRPCD